VWRQRHGYNGNTFTDEPFQTTWETSRGQKTSGAVLTRFTGGDIGMHSADLTLHEDAKQFITQFEKLYPGVSQSFLEKAVRMHWPTRAYQWGSYACYLVGQFTGLRGAEGEAVGHLYFAGEHTSLLAQGYMEGAVESGERVAKEVLAALSIG
jgi:monoamine oxidase